jgi:hypothetical protein
MPIWKLTPTSLIHPNWQTSSHRGPVTVRAPTEFAARDAAASAFLIAARVEYPMRKRKSPWQSFDLVQADRVVDSDEVEDGPVEVLHPPVPDKGFGKK